MSANQKALLMILDGWGIGDKSKGDCIYKASTPNIDKLNSQYPHAQLLACGEDVGLPEGQMGNSEVGHMNIGAGRVVYQDLVRINRAIKDDSISKNRVILDAFNYAKEYDKNVHFIGLVSDGGVHSLNKHLYKLCDITRELNLEKVFIHALMDGRDTDPHSGLGFMKELYEHIAKTNVKIASVCGRYYTMDRDKRWERIKEGYELIVRGKGKKTHDVLKAIEESYNGSVSDEFIKPIVVVDENENPLTKIKDGDVVLCFNFRTDRLRELTYVLTQQNLPEYNMHTLDLYYLTLTNYDDTFKSIKVVYDKDHIAMTLGQVISNAEKKQIRIAETEKYAHVTFFFSGGREDVFSGEKRILIQSPKVATYDLQPEMSALLVKEAIINELKKAETDFICLNFANGDMVGHTGVYDAIINAIQTIDACVAEVVSAARQNGYDVLITADHGNADHALNEDGSPNTAHSLNPVPILLVSDTYKSINNGILADIAPTILKIMNLQIPKEMTGKVLI